MRRSPPAPLPDPLRPRSPLLPLPPHQPNKPRIMQAVLRIVSGSLPPAIYPGSDLPCGGGRRGGVVLSELPESVQRNIFQRLTIKETVRLSIVSHDWYRFILPYWYTGLDPQPFHVWRSLLGRLVAWYQGLARFEPMIPPDSHERRTCSVPIAHSMVRRSRTEILPDPAFVSLLPEDIAAEEILLDPAFVSSLLLPDPAVVSLMAEITVGEVMSAMGTESLQLAIGIIAGTVRAVRCITAYSMEFDAVMAVRRLGTDMDRISGLPDCLLRNIVARLPVRDALRTRVLSPRWRNVWASTSLVLDDSHLLRSTDDQRIQLISRILIAHPGSFCSIRFTVTALGCHPMALPLWTRILANKSVEELVFMNKPMPIDIPLPSSILHCKELRRLHLGFFRFPSTTGHSGGFPHLRELGLYSTYMENQDLSYTLSSSPSLEMLSFVCNHGFPRHIHVQRSKNLRCIVLWLSTAEEFYVQNAIGLERIILLNSFFATGSTMNIKISNAPNLRVLGYLEPGVHKLVIGNTLIQAGTVVSPHTVVPNVQVLSLRVPFRDKQRSKMLPIFLRCFPSIQTLHIESTEAKEPNGKMTLASWRNMAGDIECVGEHIKKLFIHQFHGERCELAFLKFFLENAGVLEFLVVVVATECLNRIDELWNKLRDLGRSNRASDNLRILVSDCPIPLSFDMASDISVTDPFYNIPPSSFS